MKKIYKIVSIIVILVVLGSLSFIGYIYISEHIHDLRLEKERTSKCYTLSNYVEYHDYNHVKDLDEELSFIARDIKCSDLKKKEILAYYKYAFDEGLIIFDDYTLYRIVYNNEKTFSNNEQCIQLKSDINVKRIQIFNTGFYFIDENNKYYSFIENKELKELDKYDLSYSEITTFLKQENVVKIQAIQPTGKYADASRVYIILKDDGQIYIQAFKYNYSKYEMIDEEVIYSKKDYGHINDFYYNYFGEDNGKNGLSRIISDKGLYYLKHTDDQKYLDTEATFEMVPSDIYKKYKKDIKYIDGEVIFTTNSDAIDTKMISRDIDKDVK